VTERLTTDEFLARERVAMFASSEAREMAATFGDASQVVCAMLLALGDDDIEAFRRADEETRYDVLAERLGSPEELARRMVAAIDGDVGVAVRRTAYMDAAEFARFKSGWAKDCALIAERVWDEVFGGD